MQLIFSYNFPFTIRLPKEFRDNNWSLHHTICNPKINQYIHQLYQSKLECQSPYDEENQLTSHFRLQLI